MITFCAVLHGACPISGQIKAQFVSPMDLDFLRYMHELLAAIVTI